MRLRPILASLASLMLLLACGGGAGGADISLGGGPPAGNLTVKLGSDSFPGYDRVVLGIEKVEGSTNGTTWTLLGNVKSTVDLMQLQNGNSMAIVSAVSAPPATYTQFRITWATAVYDATTAWPSYVSIDTNTAQLAMPATTVLGGSVKVTAAGTTVLLMLSGQQAVQNRSYTYSFQATGSAFDLSATAIIAGHLSDSTLTTRLLANAEVYAETVDIHSVATIQRRAFTDGSGNYALEGLPPGSPYYVVAQPTYFGSSYQALASAAVTVTAAGTSTANLTFSNPLTPVYLLTIVVLPPSTATQVTWAELRKSLATGGSFHNLIVRSQTLDVALYQDSTELLSSLYPDTYDIAAQRSTLGAAPVLQDGGMVTVLGGASPMVTITYP